MRKRNGKIGALILIGMLLGVGLSGMMNGAIVDPNTEPGMSSAALYYFDEGTGQIAYDSSGNGNHAQLGSTGGVDSNDPSWTSDGLCGNALEFDGINDKLFIDDSPTMDITTDITMMVWIYRYSTDHGNLIMKKTKDHFQYGMGVTSTTFGFGYRTAKGPGTVYQHGYVSNVIVSPNEWHHVVIKYSSGNPSSAQNIIDGVVIPGTWVLGDGTGHLTSLPSYVTIGGDELDSGAPARFFEGIIDEVGIFDRYLTYSEIMDIYNAGLRCLNPNTAPEITSIVGPDDPVPVDTDFPMTGTFYDPDVGDTHTAIWDWGDESATPGTVTDGTVTGSHAYTSPGVYTITLTVEDEAGESDSAVSQQYVVIYDPSGAFITGGGMFDSPLGAFPEDPTLTGTAGFGFVSKYKNGATEPGGNTLFRFHAADIQFKSESYQWLVVAGAKGMFKGTGSINGEGSYTFLISAIDGDMTGGDGIDKFRIKIWEEDELGNENMIYDSGLESADDANPTTPLTHGSIKIHKG
jgi:hypothetical protein